MHLKILLSKSQPLCSGLNVLKLLDSCHELWGQPEHIPFDDLLARKNCAGIYVYLYFHDDVIKWKHFPRNWPFVRKIHRSPVNFPHKGQWRGALMFSLIYVWINDWANNREAGDLRRQHGHYDVIVMFHPLQNILYLVCVQKVWHGVLAKVSTKVKIQFRNFKLRTIVSLSTAGDQP